MVRQTECQKPRRSNMALSSINAAPKKGGAGGSFTWGAAQDVTDYELIGFDQNTVGVTTDASPARLVETTSLLCEINIQSEQAFPKLATAKMTPEKVAKTDHPASTAEPGSEWIIVPAVDASKKCQLLKDPMQAFDGQHPRNSFSRSNNSKQARSKRESQVLACGIDWSQQGIPTEVKKQILHASLTPSHRGLHAKEHAPTVPLTQLKAQNIGSRTRENSAPKTPRSSSKPRTIQKQPVSRR